MNSRERVIKSVTFDRPDLIPRDLWVLPHARLKHGDRLRELIERYEWDVFYNGAQDPEGIGKTYEVGRFKDAWGSIWENQVAGIMGQVVEFPLDNWTKLNDFSPPFHLVEQGWDKVQETLAAHQYSFRLGQGGSLFHRICWLRPPQEVFMDLLVFPQELTALRDMIMEYLLRRLEIALGFDYDGIMFADDWGTQRQLFISPDSWRESFKPCYAQLFRKVKEKGKLVFFHSDGYILDIIEDLIELGVDALNCQVWTMGVEELGKRFRGRICFWGEIDRQHILPHGSPEHIEEAVVKSLQYLARPDGGYILLSELSGDMPWQNIETLFRSWEEHRDYFTP